MMPALQNLTASFPPWLILGGGVALGWLRSFWDRFYNATVGHAMRKLHVAISVEETETEEAYLWLSKWAETRIRLKRITDLRLVSVKTGREGRGYEAVPHYGTYFLRFRQRYLLVFCSGKEDSAASPMSVSFLRPRRSLHVQIWGTLDRGVIAELIEEAKEEFYAGLEKKLFVYHNEGSWWENRELSPRLMETIYLPSGMTDEIVRDLRRFLASRENYRALGIPWRRGVLLYGPPGTGKSSLVQALATALELPVYYLNASSIETPEALQRLFNSVGQRSILLIEDVDCVPAARSRTGETDEAAKTKTNSANPQLTAPTTESANEKGIIAADLLNVIDGIVATEGRILILTTNHRERLDAALVRRGRVDREWHVSWAQDAEIARFHARAKEIFALPRYEGFRGMLPERTTIADAQALLFECAEVQQDGKEAA